MDKQKTDVILYNFPGGPWAPSAGPFNMKLETFLRWMKIPYENDYSGKFSSKGKTPWISCKGVDVPDSQFCMEYLMREYDLDPDGHLSPTEKAIAWAFQVMAEEQLYWVLLLCRYVHMAQCGIEFHKTYFLNYSDEFILEYVKTIEGACMIQGMGRHSDEEVYQIGRRGLKTISEFLGTKKYLMGDRFCTVDCAIFGQLSQYKWVAPGSQLEHMVTEEFRNIAAYVERIKSEIWPDWDECLVK